MSPIVERFKAALKKQKEAGEFTQAPAGVPARKLPDLNNYFSINGIRLFVVEESGDTVIHSLSPEVLVALLEVIDPSEIQRYRWLDEGLSYQALQMVFLSGHLIVHLNPVPVPRG